jgi:hypothetical protein
MEGSISKVEMTTLMALICKVFFPSISTFETPPRQDWGRAGRRKKNQKCRSNRPRRGQGPYSMFYSPASGQERALKGEHRHPQVHRCSPQPLEKNLRRGFFLFHPQDTTPQARFARRKGKTMQIDLETGEILEDGSEEELATWVQISRTIRDRGTPCEPQDETCP